MGALGTRAQRATVGPYTVVWDFAPPAAMAPLARAAWTLRTTAGGGTPAGLVDARLDSGWSSATGPPGSAWVDVDLGRVQTVSGVTLVTDRAAHLPRHLQVWVADGHAPPRAVASLETGGLTVAWRNGAPRIAPGRTVTARFPPVAARHLRLIELEAADGWAVAELFVLAPGDGASPLVEGGRQLEAAGRVGPALVRYRNAMRASPDDPQGYAEYTRLADEVGLRAHGPEEQAALYARFGLIDEARAVYADLDASLPPGLAHAELALRRADLAAAAGDAGEARTLRAVAAEVTAPRQALDVVFGRRLALTGYALPAGPVRPGETLEVLYHWRLTAADHPVAATVHFRRNRARFQDDHALPAPIAGLGAGPQHVLDRRRLTVPPDTAPGRYRVVVGVWDQTAGRPLRVWWRGLLPTSTRTVELGTVEVLGRP
jgi:hypothetical protein